MALVNGKSDVKSLDVMASFVQVACFAIQVSPYFEYVQSDSNWADEISRDGLNGVWAQEQGFALGVCTFVPQLLCLPQEVLARVLECL